MNHKPERFKYLKRFLDNDGRVSVPGYDPKSGQPTVEEKVEPTEHDSLKETIKLRASLKKKKVEEEIYLNSPD